MGLVASLHSHNALAQVVPTSHTAHLAIGYKVKALAAIAPSDIGKRGIETDLGFHGSKATLVDHATRHI